VRVNGSAIDYFVKPRYNSEAEERAHRQVLIAAGQIPFTVTRFVVFPSPQGLRHGLIFPATSK
jgi:hypothetical protein